MSKPTFQIRHPLRDLRWWGLILAFIAFLCWLFLFFRQGALIVEIFRVALTGLGAVGIKMLYDQYRHPTK
jgi:hypothetical protein